MKLYLFQFFVFFSLLSCATVQKPDGDWIVKSVEMEESEARKIMETRKEFLELTFLRMTDLNLSSPKWSDSCLGNNRVGEIKDTGRSLVFVSGLMTNAKFYTGLCPGQFGARSAQFVSIYCRREKKYIELRCFINECGVFNWEKVC